MYFGPKTQSGYVLVPNSLHGLCGRKATLNSRLGLCQKELCESRGERPGLSISNSPYGLCGRKATLNSNSGYVVVPDGALCESRGERPRCP